MTLKVPLQLLPLPRPEDGLEYRYVVGHFGYAVTNNGRVFSCKKTGKNNNPNLGYWRELSRISEKSGHLKVALMDDGIRKDRKVHQLVLEAFVGPCPAGCECLHRNGDESDNQVDNLRWGTRKENIDDQFRHQTFCLGERSPKSKLTEEQVLEIRRLLDAGVFHKDIAKKFGIGMTRISYIRNNKAWKHLCAQ